MLCSRPFFGLAAGLCVSLVVGFGAGCRKGDSSAVSINSKAFESAAPETRAAWEAAVEADRTNGYAIAYARLMQLRHPKALSPEQLQAANALFNKVVKRLSEALQRGDPEAKKAAEEIGRIDKSGH